MNPIVLSTILAAAWMRIDLLPATDQPPILVFAALISATL